MAGSKKLFDPDKVLHYIEVREIYDGWSVAVLKDGSLWNRWDPEYYPERWRKTQDFIDNYVSKNNNGW